MKTKKVNLEEKFNLFSDHWSPKVVGRLNNQAVKLVKVQGEFVKHAHDHEDEFFFVIEGTLYIEMNDQTLEINAGEFVIVPRGVEHRPYALSLVKLMLFEPATIKHTGDVRSDLTVDVCDEL